MSATRNQRRQAPAEPGEETEERRGAGREAGEASAPPPQDLPDVRALSKEQILELLAKRRGELTEVQRVAKEKGVKLPSAKKTAEDKDRLMEFFEGVGYSTGMAHWGNSRVQANLRRIAPVLEALGEGWDPERQGEAVEAMTAGFRKARIQTSFPSTSMPEKKVADKVPSAAVWKELQPYLQGLPGFIQELLDRGSAAEGAEGTEGQ